MIRHGCTVADLAAAIAACGPAQHVTLRHLEWLHSRYGRCSVDKKQWQKALELQPPNPLEGTPFGSLAA